MLLQYEARSLPLFIDRREDESPQTQNMEVDTQLFIGLPERWIKMKSRFKIYKFEKVYLFELLYSKLTIYTYSTVLFKQI